MNTITEVYTPSYLLGEASLLTEENLMRHSNVYPAGNGKADLMEMFRTSLEQENKRRLRRSRRFPTPAPSPDHNSLSSLSSSDPSSSSPSTTRSRRMSSSNNVAILAKTMPFPYHNDAIFLPTAESPPPPHFETVSLRSSVPPSLKSCRRRPSSPSVWWHKTESQSRTSVQRSSRKPSETQNVPEKKPKRKIFPEKVCHWCQKTWLRITGQ
ncbi:hypothetical protein BJV82DRAFT_577720 [Fennellomyces sp. T-0311]|nr:hypothetical protein BJV82DRAFT_577720 [Fennellomyces sp. T-0311]